MVFEQEEPQCDFCDSREIVWRYRAESFTLPTTLILNGIEITMPWGSEGDWAACARCSTMIEDGHWNALADRGVDTSPLIGLLREEEIPKLREAVYKLHVEFRKNRVGARSKTWVN
jgi:hypothetical protein